MASTLDSRVKPAAIVLMVALVYAASLTMIHRLVGMSSPLMMAMATCCPLGIARFLEPPFRIRVPRFLATIRSWELRGGIYRRLAVPVFGTLLRNSPLRLLNERVYVSRDPRHLERVLTSIQLAEAAHTWASLVAVTYSGYYLWTRRWRDLAITIAVQLLLNSYPVMHLRMVRGRLEAALSRTVRK